MDERLSPTSQSAMLFAYQQSLMADRGVPNSVASTRAPALTVGLNSASSPTQADEISEPAETNPRHAAAERRAGGVPSRSFLVPTDWRWKLMKWMVPTIAIWCVLDAYLGTNGIKVTVTSALGLMVIGGWLVANFVHNRSAEAALKVADYSLLISGLALVAQVCLAATRHDAALLQLAIQDLVIWAPIASGLSAFAYARKPWVPLVVTAGTYAALSLGVLLFTKSDAGTLQFPLHGLAIQALGILTMGVFFNRLRETVSLTIARLRLAEEQSHIDSLTGLFNRRKFDLDWSRAGIEQKGACLVLLDVDHFKAVNDNFGHATGDRVLAAVGACIASNIAGKGRAYRWGGEEFALIVTGGRLHGRMLAQRVLSEFASTRNDTHRTITLSAGLAIVAADESPEIVFQRADEALLEAKRTGRNRLVCAAHDGPLSELPPDALTGVGMSTATAWKRNASEAAPDAS